MADTDGLAVAVGLGVAAGLALLATLAAGREHRDHRYHRDQDNRDRDDGRATTARAAGRRRAWLGVRDTSRLAIHCPTQRTGLLTG